MKSEEKSITTIVLTKEQIFDHINGRQFMSTVYRNNERIQQNQEIFTPSRLVNDLLDQFDPEVFKDPNKTFCDPTCGDGQFLGQILIRKINNGITLEQALSTLYGVDLMLDNVEACRNHLLCGQEHLRYIVENNIVCASVFDYDFSFDGTFQPPATSNTSKKFSTNSKIDSTLITDLFSF